jgi:hypothetical protein
MGQRDAPARRELAVTVHGGAERVDIGAGSFRQTLVDIYTPRYGEDWGTSFLDSGRVYARIDAERMFTFAMAE